MTTYDSKLNIFAQGLSAEQIDEVLSTMFKLPTYNLVHSFEHDERRMLTYIFTSIQKYVGDDICKSDTEYLVMAKYGLTKMNTLIHKLGKHDHQSEATFVQRTYTNILAHLPTVDLELESLIIKSSEALSLNTQFVNVNTITLTCINCLNIEVLTKVLSCLYKEGSLDLGGLQQNTSEIALDKQPAILHIAIQNMLKTECPTEQTELNQWIQQLRWVCVLAIQQTTDMEPSFISDLLTFNGILNSRMEQLKLTGSPSEQVSILEPMISTSRIIDNLGLVHIGVRYPEFKQTAVSLGCLGDPSFWLGCKTSVLSGIELPAL